MSNRTITVRAARLGAPVNDRNVVCHLCGETHTVTAADSVDDRGRTVDALEAVEVAHFRAEVLARSAGPFALFNRNGR